MDYKVVLYQGYLLEKYNKLYKNFQKFNASGTIVDNKYHNHLLKSIIIVIFQMMFMRFMKKVLKMKNETGEVVLMLDLSSSMIAFLNMLKQVLNKK